MKIYNENSTISDLIDNAMSKIKTIIDTSTVVGDKIIAEDGSVIIPISKVSVGYVVGGGEYADMSARRVANHFPLAGGSSGGMSVTPVGFLVETKGAVSFVSVENKTLYQTILNTFNKILEKMGKRENNNEQN